MTVSFIIVARNAESTLPYLLSDLLSQTYDKKMIQLIFVDSCSTDKTKQIFENFKKEYESSFLSVTIKDNKKITIPCGWNLALDEAKCDVIVRVNAHSRIPVDFIEKNIQYHKNGELITGGRAESIVDGDSLWKRLLLFVENSLFGRGFSRYRNSNSTEYADTILNAFYNRKVFEKVGKFDERLPRAEDNEMHYRMRKQGFKLLLISNVVSFLNIRSTLKGMSVQKFLNGKYVGLTLWISPKCLSLYHFAPFTLVILLGLSLFLSLFSINWPLISILSLYFLTSIVMTVVSILHKKFEFIYLLSPFIFFYLHFIYGVGTVYGILIFPIWNQLTKDKKNDIHPPQASSDT